MALGTKWGLIRHYWVLLKLVLTLFATVILVLYTHTIEPLAKIAADPAMSGVQMASALLHAGEALVVVALATILAAYKPRGMTRYGQKKRQECGIQTAPWRPGA